MRRILIGCNGGLAGVYLARNLSELDDVVLFGADREINNAGKFFVEKQYVIPDTTEAGYIDKLIEILNDCQIDYYLPTHSSETRVISQNEDYLKEKTKAKFIVSPYSSYLALEGKSSGNKSLGEIGIPVPELISDEECSYPIFAKKEFGSGSAGSLVIFDNMMHKAYKNMGGYAFFEYIEGVEYTCDCLFDEAGELICANSRKRVKTIGGAVSITESADTGLVLPYIRKLADNWRLCGCVNFQYIVKDGTPFFIDVNLRYPSGGLALTVAAGMDIPKLMIRILDGESINTNDFNLKKKRMYRYFDELFEDF